MECGSRRIHRRGFPDTRSPIPALSFCESRRKPKPPPRRTGHGQQGTEKQSRKEEAQAGQKQEKRARRIALRRSGTEGQAEPAAPGQQEISASVFSFPGEARPRC